ncbi:MAG: NlpC/P60 family protein [Phascolarctobacterium sp.]|nr:NlpC/P60 family protein [Phascolarctobacterium sp.]
MNKKRFLTALLTAMMLSVSGVAGASFERGDDGQEVIDIQKRLAELNYTVSNIDGNFGPETEKAVKQFQLDRGLESDGVIGPATYKILMNREIPPNRGASIARRMIRVGYSVLGTPYVFGGTTPYGFDCSGFVQYCARNAGLTLPRMADEQYYFGRKISMKQLRAGDLIFFTTYEAGASHVGIYIGNGNFIHAGCSTGVTVSSAFTGYWGARYYGACRIL